MPDDSNRVSPASALSAKTTDWFERASASLLDSLPCRTGCHRCCLGLFPVTLLDRQALQDGLRSLPLDQRQIIEETAAHQVQVLTAAVPQLAHNRYIDHWPDRQIDHIVEQYGEMPCPALHSDNSCRLYAFRPLACRSMGIPPEIDGTIHGACEIQSFVPLTRLSRALRLEEGRLATIEAHNLAALRQEMSSPGEELFLPFAFLT